MAKIHSVCKRLQAVDYENGNGGKRRASRLTQFIHIMLQLLLVCRFVACVKASLLNLPLMWINCVPEHSRYQVDSDHVSYVGGRP